MASTAQCEDHAAANVAHHFDSPQQQLAAGKLGMWIFLVTEVLFFSGLFVAYAVYRSAHPEVFEQAHQYLSTTLGTLNTVVLLFSSLTMAWAVRCAQIGRPRGLLMCLAITMACAGVFLGVKAVEYSGKWQEGLLWAGAYSAPGEHSFPAILSLPLLVLCTPALLTLMIGAVAFSVARIRQWRRLELLTGAVLATACAFMMGVGVAATLNTVGGHSATQHAARNHSTASHSSDNVAAMSEVASQAAPPSINYQGVFFSIYYAMTGIHALHILGGIAAIGWLMWGAASGRYGPDYFNPVDFVGLYWHLVDVVWIYLFPLLYLIR
jgi:cytochrome c oxidase subunit 3